MQAELENLVVNNMQITIDSSNSAQMLVLCVALFIYTLLVWWGAVSIEDNRDDRFFPGCLLVGPIMLTAVVMIIFIIRLVGENL